MCIDLASLPCLNKIMGLTMRSTANWLTDRTGSDRSQKLMGFHNLANFLCVCVCVCAHAHVNLYTCTNFVMCLYICAHVYVCQVYLCVYPEHPSVCVCLLACGARDKPKCGCKHVLCIHAFALCPSASLHFPTAHTHTCTHVHTHTQTYILHKRT